MANYEEFFFSSSSAVVELETFEIRHSAFTEIYRFVRNNSRGMSARDELGVMRDFQYYPAKVSRLGANGTLDQSISISFGDLGELLPKELDAVALANAWNEKPVVIYRTYRSDNLNEVLYGPITLQVTTFNFNECGASFDASAPGLNTLATGLIFNYENYPGLRGFL